MEGFLSDPGIQMILRDFMELPERIKIAVQMGLMAAGGGGASPGGGYSHRTSDPGASGGYDIDRDLSSEKWNALGTEQKRIQAYRTANWWDPFSPLWMQASLDEERAALAYSEALNPPGAKQKPPPLPKPVLPDMGGLPLQEEDRQAGVDAERLFASQGLPPEKEDELHGRIRWNDALQAPERYPAGAPVAASPDRTEELAPIRWNDGLQPPATAWERQPPVAAPGERTEEVSRRFWNGGEEPVPAPPPAVAVPPPASETEVAGRQPTPAMDELLDLFRGVLGQRGQKQDVADQQGAAEGGSPLLQGDMRHLTEFFDALEDGAEAVRKFSGGMGTPSGGQQWPEVKNRYKGETET